MSAAGTEGSVAGDGEPEDVEKKEPEALPVSMFLLEDNDPQLMKTRARKAAEERIKARRGAGVEDTVSFCRDFGVDAVLVDVADLAGGVVIVQHNLPGPNWRQSKPLSAQQLRTKIRETQVLGCALSVGLNQTNQGTLVGLVNPKEVDSYQPVVRGLFSTVCPPMLRASHALFVV